MAVWAATGDEPSITAKPPTTLSINAANIINLYNVPLLHFRLVVPFASADAAFASAAVEANGPTSCLYGLSLSQNVQSYDLCHIVHVNIAEDDVVSDGLYNLVLVDLVVVVGIVLSSRDGPSSTTSVTVMVTTTVSLSVPSETFIVTE